MTTHKVDVLEPIRQIDVEVRMRVIEALTRSSFVTSNADMLLDAAEKVLEWVLPEAADSPKKPRPAKKGPKK